MVATHKQMMEHIAPETSRDDLHCVISDLYDQLTEYRIKHEVACSTLELVKERMDASQRALAAQCKQTKELERQRDELQASLYGLYELEAERDKMKFALENIRLFAARHRKEDWSLLILGFCAEGGVVGSVTR